jgi:hypothetical protein
VSDITYDFDTELLNLLPPWYREVAEYQQICNAEAQQLQTAALATQSIADNFYFQTMNLAGVQMWEQIFNITPNPATETLAFRRARVLNRISMRPPYTLGFLYQKLDELVGPGLWSVEVDYANYALTIEAGAEDQSYWQELAYTVNHIKPAHITYISRPLIRTGVLMSEEVRSAHFEWNYYLGSWALGAEPFADETDVEVVKTANINSIQPAMLNGVANFASGDVAYVQINGGIDIGTINKAVTPAQYVGGAATLTVSYNVTTTMTDAVTSVALMDANGNALTSMSVYVPVTETVNLQHTILIQEGQLNADNNT